LSYSIYRIKKGYPVSYSWVRRKEVTRVLGDLRRRDIRWQLEVWKKEIKERKQGYSR